MLKWALLFFALALVAALFGFGSIAASAALIGKLVFTGFLILAALTLVANALRAPRD